VSEYHETVGAIRRACVSICDHWEGSLDGPRVAGKVGGSNASAEAPPPVSLAVLDDRRDAHGDLAHWARVVLDLVTDIEGRTLAWQAPTDEQEQPAALARFIEHWADTLARTDIAEAELCAEELAEHARKLKAHALPDRRDWMPIGDCPVTVADTDGNSVPCGAKVRAYPDRQFIACPGCGTEDTLAWWMSQIVPEASDLAPASTVIASIAARTYRIIDPALLRKWASLDHIKRHGKDTKGRTLYSVAAVLAYATKGEKEEAA
jgi:hypothetical protein